MQEGGFKRSEADPCMLCKEYENGVCIIIISIDDMLIIGKEEAIDNAIKVLQVLILTATPLTVIRRFRLPSSNPSHWHTR